MKHDIKSQKYHVEIDNIDQTLWDELLKQFNDATIYQTWSAGKISKGEKNISHLVLKEQDEIVGLCQITITYLPITKIGIADVHRGPLWRKKLLEPKIEHFEQLIQALKIEYAVKRGLLLRVWPNEFEVDETITNLMERNGFARNTAAERYRTLLLDISLPLETLRKNLGQTWRLHLNRADKNKLTISEGQSDELYVKFLMLLEEMIDRKQFVPRVDYNAYRKIQNDLPERLKPKIMTCSHADERDPVSTIIGTGIGDTGLYLFGATGNSGMKYYGSHLLHWNMIKWLKESGCRWYDLGGINPDKNPGTYQFKRGLAGKMGEDRTLVGQFECSENLYATSLRVAIKTLSIMKRKVHDLRQSLATYMLKRKKARNAMNE